MRVPSECYYNSFKEARIIFECKIIYQDQLNPEYTPEKEKENYYTVEQYHKMYIGEIQNIWIKETD